MISPAGMLALAVALQVPPPNAAAKAAESLRQQQQAILATEGAKLKSLAEKLADQGPADAAPEVRRFLPAPGSADGSSRFTALPVAVAAPARGAGLANVAAARTERAPWKAEIDAARLASAKALFDVANKAGTGSTKYYALADVCLRAVLERQPDHPEARRLLGFVSHEGGWATPYAVEQMKQGKILHPIYGWVKSSWQPHLERGELPAPMAPGQKTERWLRAQEADDLRRDWNRGWTIDTEHFRIKTNVSLSEAIAFGRHLEAFHDLFFSLMADVLGDKLPLAQRFRDKKMTGEKPDSPHVVYYFAVRHEFVDHVRPMQGDAAETILGLYTPPNPGRSRRAPAYFFRDLKGQLDVTATLYHEVSHQLLFESGSAGLNDYKKNAGNFWVFEGLGTYFETLVTRDDGSLEIGGLRGARIEAAKENLAKTGRAMPLSAFVRLDQDRFSTLGDVYVNYQQATALTVYLMQANGGKDREAFLDYVKDAYHGRLGRTSGRSLEARLGRGAEELEGEYLAYLKQGAKTE
jgi:hypothetical protein